MGKPDFEDQFESGSAASSKVYLAHGEAVLGLRPEQAAWLIATIILLILFIPAFFRQPKGGPVGEAIQYAEQVLRADAAARDIEVDEVEAQAFGTDVGEDFYLARLELRFRMRCPGTEQWLDFSTVGTYSRKSSGWTHEMAQDLGGACRRPQ